MKNKLFLALFGLFPVISHAQGAILYVPNNDQLTVLANETFYLDGLVLENSQIMTIENTSLFYTNTPAVFTAGEGVKRVYEWTNEMTAYDGLISFRYDNIDLNNLNENDLKIATSLNGGNYSIISSNSNSATGFVLLDNNVSNFSFDKVTLVTEELLDITDIKSIGEFVLFPNPALSNLFYIKSSQESNSLFNILVFDELGREVIIDLEYIGSGTYKCVPRNILASGTYIVRIKNGNSSTIRKLVI